MRYTSHVTRSLKIILHRLQIIGHHHGNDWIRTTSYLLCVLLLLEQLGVCMCLHGTPPGKAPPWNIPSINTSHTSHSSPPTSTSSLPVVSLKYISDNQEYSCEGELCLGNQHGIDAIICAGNAGKSESAQDRVRILRRTRLDFCDRYLAYNALDLHQCDIANVPERQCRMCFQALLQREALAKQAYVNFLEVLAKFDCRENFSTWSYPYNPNRHQHASISTFLLETIMALNENILQLMQYNSIEARTKGVCL
ncbi:hypothetical protein CAPTEDRAFT_215226 [Capitella teleta]|uniref:Uncharacterized protein n=1 Tax=Capitella teleta TaxID=283909 RepID=R7VKK4_CAPTE|nr:hypothetical protein CAPTEDRAFT_215226 [Capitella teleta]|eukprot:ELU17451.1 hypothetical protein CAPTEDRAFT_215226 [Capitella teleta]